MIREGLALAATLLCGLGSAGRAGAAPATEVANVVAVDAGGQPASGYREGQPGGQASDCPDPSPAAVSDNIYRCYPNAIAANVCWPSTTDSLLCVNFPWTKQLRRVTYTGSLPAVQPVETPLPFALALDDGTQCTLRNGGAWGGRDDGYAAAYGCQSSVDILARNGQPAIDRSTALWTVEVGPTGGVSEHFPPPETRTVATAWFAG